MPALVMNCLAPLTTHSPSSSAARVRTLPASEPASGSVSPKAPSLAPAHRSGSSASFCSSRAEEVDRLRPQRRVRAHRDRHARVHARELLDRQRVLQRRAAGAADLLGERDAHPPELAHLGHDLVGEALLAVELLGDRRAPPARRSRGRSAAGGGGRRGGRSASRHCSQIDNPEGGPHPDGARSAWHGRAPPRQRARASCAAAGAARTAWTSPASSTWAWSSAAFRPTSRGVRVLQRRLAGEPLVDSVVPTGGGYFCAPPGARGGQDWVGSGLFA